MPFQFSFALPTFPNPFSAATTPSTSEDNLSQKNEPERRSRHSSRNQHMHPRLSPSPAPSVAPSTGKRGWEPSYASAPSSASIATVTTDGYLDTPAKYKDIAGLTSGHEEEQEMLEEMMEDLRPAKRRKTFTDSVVSTAYSAALISTAVGFTVYKYWRDRGKERPAEEEELGNFSSPPPPYEPQWSPHVEVSPPSPSSPAIQTPRSERGIRPIAANSRTRKRHTRKGQRRPRLGPSTPSLHSVPSRSTLRIPDPSTHGAYDDNEEETDEVGSQIDSMSARLAKLIADGQRALNTEVVVSSESREDELDDGMGQWIEDDDFAPPSSPSKSIHDGADLRSHPVPTTLHSPSRPGYPILSPPGSFPFS